MLTGPDTVAVTETGQSRAEQAAFQPGSNHQLTHSAAICCLCISIVTLWGMRKTEVLNVWPSPPLSLSLCVCVVFENGWGKLVNK